MSTKTTSTSGLWVRHCDADTSTAVEGELTGSIPTWLNGRLVRNGPGERKVGSDSYYHLFDGMALLHMININDGKATYSSRFLESDAYKMNHRANRIVVTEFGTVGVPDPCLSLFGKFNALFSPSLSGPMTDNCLVNVLQVKDQLLAMTETDIVRIVDPETLATKEEKLKYSRYVSIQRATAHPHVDSKGTVYNLGFDTSKGPMKYSIVSLPDGKMENAKVEASVQSRWKFHPSYMHSFGITENYFILAESPLVFDVFKLSLPKIAQVSVFDALKYYKAERTCFRIISRSTGKEIQRKYFAPEFFTFHFSNCFESNGNIVIDLCAAEGDVIHSLAFKNLDKDINDSSKIRSNFVPMRFVLPIDDLDNKEVGEELLKNVPEAKISREDLLACASAVIEPNGDIFAKGLQLAEDMTELPRINYQYNMKPYKYAYMARVSNYKTSEMNLDSLIKLNVTTGEKKIFQDDEYFCSEPVFVAAPDSSEEDNGVVLALLLHKTEVKKVTLLVLDAKEWTETARVSFTANGTVTTTFHGQFMGRDQDTHAY